MRHEPEAPDREMDIRTEPGAIAARNMGRRLCVARRRQCAAAGPKCLW